MKVTFLADFDFLNPFVNNIFNTYCNWIKVIMWKVMFKKNTETLKAVQLSFVSNLVFWTKCVCDSTAITARKSYVLWRYINKYTIEKFTVSICIECLHRISERVALNRMSVLNRNRGEKNVSKCVKLHFKQWLCDGRVLAFISGGLVFYSYLYQMVMLSWDSHVFILAWWLKSPQLLWPPCCCKVKWFLV